MKKILSIMIICTVFVGCSNYEHKYTNCHNEYKMRLGDESYYQHYGNIAMMCHERAKYHD